MKLVVLSGGGVQVSSCEFINSVISKDLLEELKGKEVRVSLRRGIKEYSNVKVGQLIISHLNDWGSEVRLFLVGICGLASGSNATECLVNCTKECFVVDLSGSSDNDVLSDVVAAVEVSDVLSGHIDHVFSDSWYWLTHVVIPVGSVVSSFNDDSLIVFGVDGCSVDTVSFGFDLCWAVERVVEEISQECHSLFGVRGVETQGVGLVFSGGFGVEESSESAELLLDLLTGPGLGSLFSF